MKKTLLTVVVLLSAAGMQSASLFAPTAGAKNQAAGLFAAGAKNQALDLGLGPVKIINTAAKPQYIVAPQDIKASDLRIAPHMSTSN